MSFRTLAGIVRAEIIGDRVKVRMTAPHSLKTGLKLDADGRQFDLDLSNTGVPHAVCFAPDEDALESTDVRRWGHALRFMSASSRREPMSISSLCGTPIIWSSARTNAAWKEKPWRAGTGLHRVEPDHGARNRAVSPVEVKTRGGEALKVYFETEGEGRSRRSRVPGSVPGGRSQDRVRSRSLDRNTAVKIKYTISVAEDGPHDCEGGQAAAAPPYLFQEMTG